MIRHSLAAVITLAVHCLLAWLLLRDDHGQLSPAALAVIAGMTNELPGVVIDEVTEPDDDASLTSGDRDRESKDEALDHQADDNRNDNVIDKLEGRYNASASNDYNLATNSDDMASGNIETMPLRMRWPVGGDLLAACQHFRIVILALDRDGSVLGHVNYHHGRLISGMPLWAKDYSFDPRSRFLPQPAQQVLPQLSSHPQAAHIALLLPQGLWQRWQNTAERRNNSHCHLVQQNGAWLFNVSGSPKLGN